MTCVCDEKVIFHTCPECGYQRPEVVRYELHYIHGPLSFTESVDDIAKGKARLRHVLNLTHDCWPITEATISGFDSNGDAQVMAHWYGVYGGWGAKIYP